MRPVDDVTAAIIEAAIEIHRGLGPGLFESVYETVLASVLHRRGHEVSRQAPIRFAYDGITFDDGLRVDLLVDGRVIVELKSVERVAPIHHKQLLTYLRLAGLPVGLLLNFGAPTLVDGLHRIVNGLPAGVSTRLEVNRVRGSH